MRVVFSLFIIVVCTRDGKVKGKTINDVNTNHNNQLRLTDIFNKEPYSDKLAVVVVLNKNNKNVDNLDDYDYVFVKREKDVARRGISNLINLKQERRKERMSKLVKKQHEKKLDEIMEFLDEHYLSTNYIYNEIMRIKKERTVFDDLRKMVAYLEKPDKIIVKKKLLECFENLKADFGKPPKDLWKSKTNDLVINVLKDPYNDGFIN